MKKYFLTITTIIILAATGCQNLKVEEISQENDISANYLTFKSADEYFETCDKLVNMNS